MQSLVVHMNFWNVDKGAARGELCPVDKDDGILN